MSKKDKSVDNASEFKRPAMRQFNLNGGLESSVRRLEGKGFSPILLDRIGADKLVKEMIMDLQGRGYVFSGEISEDSIAMRNRQNDSVLTINIHPDKYQVVIRGIPDGLVEPFGKYFSERKVAFNYSRPS